MPCRKAVALILRPRTKLVAGKYSEQRCGCDFSGSEGHPLASDPGFGMKPYFYKYVAIPRQL